MKKKHRIVSMILAIGILFITLIPAISLAADVTNKVNISGVNVYINNKIYIEDGVIVGKDNPMVGNSIKIEYRWGIDKDSLSDMNAGDEIYFNLPTDFYSFENSEENPLMSDGEELGTIQIIGNKIKIVLNQTAVDKDGLKNGIVFATGKITKDGKDVEIDVDGDAKLPPITILPPGGSTGELPNNSKDAIKKNGEQIPNRNEIFWQTIINYDNLNKRFNGESFDTLNEAFFIDELQSPQIFKGIKIQTILHTATSEGKISNNKLSYVDLAPWGAYAFQKVDPTTETTIEEFKKTMRDSGKASYGVMNNTVVVYFGDIPSEEMKLPNSLLDNNRKGIKDLLDAQFEKGQITKEQYDKSWAHYSTGKEDQIIQFQIRIDVDIPNDFPNQDLKNTAQLTWRDSTIESEEIIVHFQNVGGSIEVIEPKAIKIKKVDDEGNRLQGVKFKITKLKEGSTTEYEDYLAPDEGDLVRTTNEKGIVEFQKLHTGKYKIVEVSGLTGYGGAVFSPSDTFEIKDNDIKGFLFKVTNPKLLKIEGEKTWDDNNNQDGKRPTEIKVQLYKTVNNITETVGESILVTPNSSGRWNYSFDNLPKYENGVEISYSVQEEAVQGYIAEYDGVNINNRYDPLKTAIHVVKNWDDNNNQDGKRPNEIEIQLLENGEEIGTPVELNEGNSWRYSYTNLPKYKDGEEIKYTIKEIGAVDGYESPVIKYFNDNFVIIINKSILSKIDIEGEKTWDHGNNPIENRPKEITVYLLQNGNRIHENWKSYTKVVKESDDWKYKWEDLPKLDSKGNEYVYTIIEKNIPNYEAMVIGTNIKNVYIPTTTLPPPTENTDPTKNTESTTPIETNPTINTKPTDKVTKPTDKITKPTNSTEDSNNKNKLPKMGIVGTVGLGIAGIGLVLGGINQIRNKK